MPEETKVKEVKETEGKPANCMKCNKRLQRKSWYYRNGGYYCSKRCWKLKASKKDAPGKEVKKEEPKQKQAPKGQK